MRLVAVVLLCAATSVFAQRNTLGVPQGDEFVRQQPVDEKLELPASSGAARPIEFGGFATRGLNYFVEPGTLTVSRDGEVRFMMIVRSPSGVDNASYEGFRCTRRERRTYATGAAGGGWVVVPEPKSSPWSPVPAKTTNHHFAVLYEEYFCPKGLPIADAAEGVSALRRGGNPRAGL